MLVKSFTDDLSWEVQRQLVNNYFRKTPEPVPVPVLPKPVESSKYIFILDEQLNRLHRIHEGRVTISEFCEVSKAVANMCEVAHRIKDQ